MKIVTTFKNSKPERLRNLEAFISYYSKFNYEIVVIEQGDSGVKLHGVNHIKLTIDNDMFHKTKLLNSFLISDDSESYLIVDNDCIIDYDIDLGFKQCIEKPLFPFNCIYFLNPMQTKRFIDGSFVANEKYSLGDLMITAYTGAAVFISRSHLKQIHFYDEIFVGWGGEDDALIHKLNLLNIGINRFDGNVYHLYHRSNRSKQNTLLSESFMQMNFQNLENYFITGIVPMINDQNTLVTIDFDDFIVKVNRSYISDYTNDIIDYKHFFNILKNRDVVFYKSFLYQMINDSRCNDVIKSYCEGCLNELL